MKNVQKHCRPVTQPVADATTNFGALLNFFVDILERAQYLPSQMLWKAYFPPGGATGEPGGGGGGDDGGGGGDDDGGGIF